MFLFIFLKEQQWPLSGEKTQEERGTLRQKWKMGSSIGAYCSCSGKR